MFHILYIIQPELITCVNRKSTLESKNIYRFWITTCKIPKINKTCGKQKKLENSKPVCPITLLQNPKFIKKIISTQQTNNTSYIRQTLIYGHASKPITTLDPSKIMTSKEENTWILESMELTEFKELTKNVIPKSFSTRCNKHEIWILSRTNINQPLW